MHLSDGPQGGSLPSPALTPFSIHLLHHRHSPPRLSQFCIDQSQLSATTSFLISNFSHLYLLEVSTQKNPSFQIY